MKMMRRSYQIILDKYKNIKKGTVRLTQSTLILIRPIVVNSTTYMFPVLENDGNNPQPYVDEIRLNQNDEFIAYDIGYYVSATLTGGDPTVGTTYYWLTYAPLEFSTKFLQLCNAWYGKLEILVNKITRLEKWDLKKHNIIPRTQFKNSTVGLPYATQPSLDYSNDGIFPMQPMLTIAGAKKTNIQLELVTAVSPTASAIDWTLPDATTAHFVADRLVLKFQGMLAQNAASFQK
jgi:hypothetical protein